jgi:hypothetical protein
MEIYKIKHVNNKYLSTTGVRFWWVMDEEKLLVESKGKIYQQKSSAKKILNKLNKKFPNKFSLYISKI